MGTVPGKMAWGGMTLTRCRDTLADDFSEYVTCPKPHKTTNSQGCVIVRRPDGTREVVSGRVAASAALERVIWACGRAKCGAKTGIYEKNCHRCWAPRPASDPGQGGAAAFADSPGAQVPEYDKDKARKRSRGGKHNLSLIPI